MHRPPAQADGAVGGQHVRFRFRGFGGFGSGGGIGYGIITGIFPGSAAVVGRTVAAGRHGGQQGKGQQYGKKSFHDCLCPPE